MKKFLNRIRKYINILLLIPFSSLVIPLFIGGPSIPGCQVYTTGTTITYTGASNITISDKLFNASGGLYSIKLVNCDHIHITRCKFINQKSDGANYSGAIDITNSTNVYIDTCYFYNCGYGVLGHPVSPSVQSNGTNFRCVYNQFLDIHQDSTTNGNGSAVQLNNWAGSGMRVDSNYAWSPNPNKGIGDQFSFFQCNGTSGSPILCNYNQILGGSTNTTGKAGIVLGDVGGSWQSATGNLMVNPGASALLVQGGTNIQANSNSFFSDGSNSTAIVGLSYGNFSGTTSNNITIGFNKISWTNPDASIFNKLLFTSHGETTPTNWTTNTADHTKDPTILVTLVPNPLWSACVGIPIISYTGTPFTFSVSGAVSQSPTNSGGSSTNWSVSPALPSGLSINATTGIISGAPGLAQSATNYVISATNTSGTGTTTISITITGSSLIVVTGRKFIQL